MFKFDVEMKRKTGAAVIAATPVEVKSASTSVSLTTVVESASILPKDRTATSPAPLKPEPVMVIV